MLLLGYIELTSYNSNNLIGVFVNHIKYIMELNNGSTMVRFEDNVEVTVRESEKEIFRIIEREMSRLSDMVAGTPDEIYIHQSVRSSGKRAMFAFRGKKP